MNQPISPTPTVQTSNILDEYADIRWQMAALSAKLEEIEPMAIERALSIINEGATANGKRVVYRTDTVDIILQLRSQKPKPENHADLESLKELIELEAEKAQYQTKRRSPAWKGRSPFYGPVSSDCNKPMKDEPIKLNMQT